MPQIHDGSQWKNKCEEVQLENKKLKRQMQSVRADTTSVLLTKRFENLQGFLEYLWVVYQKNMDNAISHNRIYNRIGTILHEKTMANTDVEVIKGIQKLLKKHEDFDTELQNEFNECK